MSLDADIQSCIESRLDNDEFFIDWLENTAIGQECFGGFYCDVLHGYGVPDSYGPYDMDGEMFGAFLTWDRTKNGGQAERRYTESVVEWAHEKEWIRDPDE